MNTSTPLLLCLLLLAGCADSQPGPSPTPQPQQHQPVLQLVPAVEDAAEPITSVDQLAGKVIKVSDGDTIDILTADQQTIRVRLNGIDAPERGQPFGNNARNFVSQSIGGEDVSVQVYNQDRYGRTIGDVYFNGRLINLELVRLGLAWHYLQYAPTRSDLAGAEAEARNAGLGLWSDPRHVAPWDWRKLTKDERDQLR